MIKKIFLVTMLSCLTLMLQAAKKDTVTVDNLRFEINEEQTAATLLIYPDANHKYSGDVIIPSSIAYAENQLPVTAIGYGAFKDCVELRTINIPTSINSIGKDAFQGCSGLYTAEYYNLDHLYDITYDNEKSNPLSFTRMLLINGKEVNTLSINKNVPNYGFCQATWLKNVTFTDAVTTIGERGFYGCTSLSEITLPNSITQISKLAFRECKFTSIVIPDNCKLESDVFQKCQQLTTVKLPANLEEIPSALFDGCIMLQDLTLPEGVKTIKERAFQNCNKLTKIPSNNVLESIEDGAFQGCTGFTIITIPATVKYIWANAFSGCKNLTDVFCLPTTPPTSKENSFGTQVSSLKLHVSADAGVLNSYKDDDKWKLFGTIDVIKNSKITFYINDQVHHIINQQGGSVVSLTGLNTPTGELFSGWDKEIPLYMPNDNLDIYGYLSKEYLVNNKILYYLRPAEQLNGNNISPRAELISIDKEKAATDTEINIPENIDDNGTNYPVITIPNRAFEGLSNLQSASLPNNTQHLGEQVFKGCSSLTTVTLPQALTTLPVGFFDGCSSLQSIQLPSNVTTIGKQAFRYCSKLSELPSTSKWQSVGAEAFKGCSSLTHAELPDNCEMSTDIFQNCALLETVTLPSTLTAVPSATFDGCYKLQNITLPENITSIGKNAFRNCELLTILPTTEKLKEIGDMAFKNCRALVVVTLPSTIESIGADAFDGCTKLTDVYCMSSAVPDAAATAFSTLAPSLALHIKENASSQLLNNYQATAPWNTFKSIDRTRQSTIYFYVNDEKHWKITQRGGTLTDSTDLSKPTIGIFSGWDKTIPVFMPNDDLAIYGYVSNELVFDGIIYLLRPSEQLNGKNLEKRAEMITIEKELTAADTEIDVAANIKFNNDLYPVTAIGANAFEGQSSLQVISIPATVATIGKSAFKGCTALTTIQLPDILTAISDSLFEGCSALPSLALPAAVTTIGNYAFRNCRALATLPSNTLLQEIGKGAFQNCVSLTTLVMDEMTQLRAIRKDAFTGCQKVFSLTLPTSLTTLEEGAFRNCTQLIDVFSLAATVPTTDADAFGGSQGAMNLYVPKDYLAGYQQAEPWKSFGEIHENGKFSLTFYVNDEVWYQATQMGGTLIDQTLIPTPTRGIFSGWDKEIPTIMPGRATDVFGYVSQLEEIGDFQYQLLPAEQLNGKGLQKRAIVQKVVKKLTQNVTMLQVPDEVTFEEVTYPVIGIGANVFEGASYLERIILPSTITTIGNQAFKGCSSLRVVSNFPTTMETLSDGIFMDCKALSQFTLSEHVKSIGKQAFSGCTSLKELLLPAELKTLGYQAFANSAIEQITLPASISTMGEEVFKQCRSLHQATFAEGFVQSLPKFTFWNCQALEQVTLQGTMVSILEGAFQGCSKLSIFMVPEGIMTIGSKAFKDCTSLSVVTLPASLELIGRECFSGSTAISQLTVNSTEAPSANLDAFEQETYNYANLYVPTLEAYQDEPWKFFRSKGVIKEYAISYIVDGQLYKKVQQLVGSPITLEQEPVKEGHPFSGWLQQPTVMPAKDITVVGNFQYQIRYYENEADEANRLLADETFAYYYGDAVTLPAEELKRTNYWYVVHGLTEEPMGEDDAAVFQTTMPGNDLNAILIYHRTEDERVLDGITYKIYTLKKYAVVASADKAITVATIPATVNYEGEELPLLHIEDSAFIDCTLLAQLTLPEGLLTIGNRAFKGCSAISSLTIPASIESLGDEAFYQVLGDGDVITLMGATLPEALATTFDDATYEKALLRTQVEMLTGTCWPLFKRVRLFDPSGLQTIHAAPLSSDAPIYDLNGRMVAPAGSAQRLPKGIYIQHGKRILIR